MSGGVGGAVSKPPYPNPLFSEDFLNSEGLKKILASKY
jgi:hypothetical protein